MTMVRRLWRAAKYFVEVIASVRGLAWVAFVAGDFVWGIAKGITRTMSDPPISVALQSTVEARVVMTMVRRLWRNAKYVGGVIAAVSGIAWVAFVTGGFVWGIAKGITGTMSDPSGWNEWLSILGGGVLILFGLIIVLGAIRELLKYIFVLPRHRSHKPTWGLFTFLLFGLVLLVEGAFCITDAPVFKLPLVGVSVGMMLTLFLEGREEAKFTKELLEAETRARQQAPTTLVQDIREALYGEEVNDH